MNKSRLEAFSDGVLAIIITIMVLELKVPEGSSFVSLEKLFPKFLAYILSFIYVGIYWNNHHHMLQTVKKVTGAILWSNLHLLFWLSLIPFVTAWAGDNNFSNAPMMLYGIVLLCNALAYTVLQYHIIHAHGKESLLAKAVGNDSKGKISLLLYTLGILLAYSLPIISGIIYTIVALLWLIPDKRIEKIVAEY